MTMDKPSNHVAEQAAAYHVRRADETATERREREAWLARDVRHARAYDDMQRLWEGLGGLRDNPELQALKAADLAALRRSRWPSAGRLLLAAAAALLVLLGGLYLARRVAEAPTWVSYATKIGERHAAVLEDGTRIVLNTDSTLQVRYTRGQRDVTLQRGEAQFEVAHDAARPFVIHVGADTVTALGTRFQVRREADAVAVTLLKGSVEITQGEERRVLHPNERAQLTGNAIRVRAIDPAQADGWLDGWLRFRDTPLSEVVAEANRYSTRKLRLDAPALAGLTLSGNFRTGDNASIAAAVGLLLPVRVEEGKEIVIRPK